MHIKIPSHQAQRQMIFNTYFQRKTDNKWNDFIFMDFSYVNTTDATTEHKMKQQQKKTKTQK